tara:strand:- start:1245 stop:1598 length:354 start_codon:yes stop_codon:yes gene_type:complete
MSRGLGDSIEKITKITGLKKLTEAIVGEDCGCKERKEWLNKHFPYTQGMDKEQQSIYKRIKKSIEDHKGILKKEQQDAMNILYQQVFKKKIEPTRCTPCIADRLRKLEAIYKHSCNE